MILIFKKQAQKLIGIDIGFSTIKMVEVSQEENPKLIKWASVPCTENLKKDIKKCRKALKASTADASLCLSDPSLIVKELLLPFMAEKELLNNIRFELSEYFSDNFKEYEISCRYIKKPETGADLVAVLVAAAPLSVLRKHKDILESAGLNVKHIDVSPNVLSKVLRRTTENKEAVCIMDIGTKAIDVSVYENGNYFVHRTSVIEKDCDKNTILSALTQVLDYCRRKNSALKDASVLLIGMGHQLPNIDEYLSRQTNLPVKIARPDMFSLVYDIPEYFPATLYFKALGAAIREG